jgi:hypothetical protein
VADLVRCALWPAAEVRGRAVAAIRHDHPGLGAEETADAWLAEAFEEWRAEASRWPAVTDHDRLLDAFEQLRTHDVAVLVGVEDHWAARDELARRTPIPAGIAWFTPTDVWHAIDAGMLEVNLWHGDTANAAPGDALLDDAIAAFVAAGLEARFDEGRIEVSARWQVRPG